MNSFVEAKSGGQTALLIDGAHRVGKSFIVELFVKQEYKSHIIIDFGNEPQDILDLFINESADLDLFFVGRQRRHVHGKYRCTNAQAQRAQAVFCSRNDSENRENHMEIDFLIMENKKIAPIELKSANYRSHPILRWINSGRSFLRRSASPTFSTRRT